MLMNVRMQPTTAPKRPRALTLLEALHAHATQAGQETGLIALVRHFPCSQSQQLIFILDVDECINGQANCDAHAGCTNTQGSFICACKSGWTGPGTACTGTYIAPLLLTNTKFIFSKMSMNARMQPTTVPKKPRAQTLQGALHAHATRVGLAMGRTAQVGRSFFYALHTH